MSLEASGEMIDRWTDKTRGKGEQERKQEKRRK